MTNKFPNEVKGRVSLVVPCYEVDLWINDFVASVIQQDWEDLEIILVNDGSTQPTTSALYCAANKLNLRGWRVILIEQENKGLGGAVDIGLKYVSGEFLMWPDPDDWLTNKSIARRVELMREHPDIGILRSNCIEYLDDIKMFGRSFFSKGSEKKLLPDLFEHLIFQKAVDCPVAHFVRASFFWKVHPDRSIWFNADSSQNFQLLVPFAEKYPVLQTSEVLAFYRVRKYSRSRWTSRSQDDLLKRYKQLYESAMQTICCLETYTPDREFVLANFHWRNKMLPAAMRAQRFDLCCQLILGSSLGRWNRSVALALVGVGRRLHVLRVSMLFNGLFSRAICRVFDMVVRMPSYEVVWGSSSLWADKANNNEQGSSLA